MNTFAVPDGLKIGSGILWDELANIITKQDDVMLIVDKVIDELYGQDVYDFLCRHAKTVKREFVRASSLREALLRAYYIVNRDFDVVIAMGGGKVLDVGKYASSMSERKFISIPTSLSHDGVASPVAVLKCDHGAVRSLPCRIPADIIMDLSIIKTAPRMLLLSGVGDMVSNITALRDWKKAADAGRAHMDDFAYIISGTAVQAILQFEEVDLSSDRFLKQLAESLVLSGLAMNIAGNSRPSSGAEHLISHAIDAMGKGRSHGLQAGMATVLVEYLYGGNHEFIRNYLKKAGLPASFADLDLSYEDYLQVMRAAPSMRKGRYTILDELDMSDENLKKIFDAVYGD